jgi:hypothetical protein
MYFTYFMQMTKYLSQIIQYNGFLRMKNDRNTVLCRIEFELIYGKNELFVNKKNFISDVL